VLRICIPVHNEATTIGVLLWRLRSVFQGFSREYDVVVYDDASSDGTGEVLEPYRSVMPLTVLRGAAHRGYAASIDALVRHVASDDEYARRDAMVLLQGDFTESPEHLPELIKRFEGGADLVAVHRTTSDATPDSERRLRRWGRWAVTPFLRLPPVADPFTGFRLVRISVLRELLKALGARPVCAGEGWAANIDFALNVTPFARRIENVEFAPRYDVRQRPSRRRGWPDVVALFHWARSARRTARPTPGAKAPAEPPSRAASVTNAVVSLPAERALRDAVPDRGERAERAGRPERAQRPAREQRPARRERPPRDERPAPSGEMVAAKPFVEQPSAKRLPDIETADPRGASAAPALVTDGEAVAPEKRSRRRRRRSRRDRGAATADGNQSGAAPATAPFGHSSDGDDDAGTTDDAQGEDESGNEESDGTSTASVSGEAGADGARKKRRSRRRRRGRRPGGPDTSGADNSGPDTERPSAGGASSGSPSAEPPAA
jgi:Glycosyl transferase family 2